MFEDLFQFALKNLNQAYLEFKKTENFFLLKEEIIRKEKLYEIMIEAGIINWLKGNWFRLVNKEILFKGSID